MRIGLYGFGSINRLLTKYAIQRGYEIIGVVDIDEKIVGRDIGEILGLEERVGVHVSKSPDSLKGSELIYHATGSYLDKVYRQIINSIEAGANVISTCETLAYPHYRYPVLARLIDEHAKRYGVSVVGTGINPGFLLDTLVILFSTTLPYVNHVKATRVLDAAKRREPFRRKIGVGERPSVVGEKLATGEYTGHVGYAESVLLIAEAGGVHLDRVIESQEPVVAEDDVCVIGICVKKGFVKGIKGFGVGFVGGREVIRIELQAYVGADEHDEVLITSGDRRLVWRSNGVHGDVGTVSVMLNLGEKIHYYPPGLLTMNDLVPFRIRIST